MEDRARRVPRRKPVPSLTQFDDFDLQPLRLSYAHSSDSHISRSTSTNKPLTNVHDGQTATHSVSAARLRNWTPFYLERPVLVSFIALFATLFITLIALFSYSQSHQGLSTADEKDYYLWTYGPTAVLTVIAAFWGQVVYWNKQLMPWRAMASKPQPASKSVLLDYVSPASLVTLYKAILNAHYVVSLAVITSFIFVALTILSTGLFSLQYTDVTTYNVPLLVTNKFDLSNFDWSSVDARSTAITYATKNLNLSYPPGTTAKYAVQTFSDPHRSNTTLGAVVDAFSADLDCEEATLTVTNVTPYSPYGALFHSGATFTINMKSSSCTAVGISVNSATVFDSNDPYNGTEYLTWGLGRFIECSAANEHRVLVSVATYRVREQWNATEDSYPIGLVLPYDQMFQVVNSSNVLCTPSYRIEKAIVNKKSNTTSTDVLDGVNYISVNKNEGPTDKATEIARGVFASINDPTAQDFYANGTSFPTSADTFFTLLGTEGTSSSAAALESYWFLQENLIHNSETLYGSIAAQLAAQKLLISASDVVSGNVTMNEPRLFVRVLSFALMETCIVLLVLFAGYLLLWTSSTATPKNLGSIYSMATVLGDSADLANLVKDTSARQISDTEPVLHEHMYHTSWQHNSIENREIHISAEPIKGMTLIDRLSSSQNLIKWWQPSMCRTPIRLLVVLTPLVYIAVLEILFRLSQSNNGLLGIENDSWLHYGYTFIPALLMVCVHMIYSSVNFSVRLLGPYSMLHKGSVPASLSIRDHPLSRVAIHDLFISAKRGQFAVFASTFSILLAPMLTITVSGLYEAENYAQNTQVQQLTGWNFNVAHIPNNTLTGDVFNHMNQSNPTNYTAAYTTSTVTDLIVTANLSYPLWTYEELAFPVVEAKSFKQNNGTSATLLTGSFDVTLPAVRGALNCTTIPHQEIQISYATWNATSFSGILNETEGWGMEGNRYCLNYTAGPATGQGEDSGSTGCRVALFTTNSTKTLGGCTIPPEVIFLPETSSDSQYFGYFTPSFEPNRTYCPLYSGMLGTTTSQQIEDYTWFVCATTVERVMAHTTFVLPQYSISSAFADDSTASKVVGNSTMDLFNATGLEFGSGYPKPFSGINAALTSGITQVVDPNDSLTFYNMTEGQNYDNFFSALVYGRDGVPPDELFGENNRSRLFSAVQHLWRIVYAQTFRSSSNYLSADPDDIKVWAPQPWNGTSVDPNSYRLKQSAISTRILQGILAALSLCAIVTFSMMDTRKVLPNNPSSIAVVAGLVADSELLSMMASDGHRKSGNAQNNSNRWDGYFFSLGWWDRPGAARRFGIDIGKAEKAG